jgi:hypothetical protein
MLTPSSADSEDASHAIASGRRCSSGGQLERFSWLDSMAGMGKSTIARSER